MEITVEINGKTYLVKIRDLNANPVMAEVDGQSYAVYPGGAPAGVLPQAAPAHSPNLQAAAPAAPTQQPKPHQPLLQNLEEQMFCGHLFLEQLWR